MSINKVKKYFLIFGCVTLILSCENSVKTTNNSKIDTTLAVNQVMAVPEKDSLATSWIDSFKDFRQAIYLKDKAKLKTYFSFPITGEGSSIWQVCSLSEEEVNKRYKGASNSDSFSEEDFDKYYIRIFNQKFLKALLKIKSAELYNKHNYKTQEFADQSNPYTLYAEYNGESQILQLNMAFQNNGTDENGEYVSEGEYNIVYVFDVIDGKELKFRKVVIAG